MTQMVPNRDAAGLAGVYCGFGFESLDLFRSRCGQRNAATSVVCGWNCASDVDCDDVGFGPSHFLFGIGLVAFRQNSFIQRFAQFR